MGASARAYAGRARACAGTDGAPLSRVRAPRAPKGPAQDRLPAPACLPGPEPRRACGVRRGGPSLRARPASRPPPRLAGREPGSGYRGLQARPRPAASRACDLGFITAPRSPRSLVCAAALGRAVRARPAANACGELKGDAGAVPAPGRPGRGRSLTLRLVSRRGWGRGWGAAWASLAGSGAGQHRCDPPA